MFQINKAINIDIDPPKEDWRNCIYTYYWIVKGCYLVTNISVRYFI